MTYSPTSGVPTGALWPATTREFVPGSFSARDYTGASFWTAEISSGGSDAGAPAPFGITAGLPTSSFALPPGLEPATTTLRVSDRRWVTEPDDPVAPNQVWPDRMLAPPSIGMRTAVYPDEPRRADTAFGELLLANADGGLEGLASGWRLAGQKVVLLRGPHRRPVQAATTEVAVVAEMRVAEAVSGTSRLRLALRSAAADLTVPVCRTYAGTGGREGTESLVGQAVPLLYGARQAISPVLVDPGLLLYQIHDGPIAAVVEVRNRGGLQTPAGNHATYEALVAAVVADGTYQTCLASGHLRMGSTPTALTVSALGDAGLYGYSGGAGVIAVKILRGPGGLDEARAPAYAFSTWPTGEAGLYLTGGTVAQAMERLAAGIGATWGADAYGRFFGRALTAPEEQGPAFALRPWMLVQPPEEDRSSRAPWWRSRVAYGVLDTVLSGQNLLESLSAEVRDALSQPSRLAVAVDLSVRERFIAAEDGPVIESIFTSADDAAALATQMQALFGQPRRAWRVRVRLGAAAIDLSSLMPGAFVALYWPSIAALADGPTLMVTGIDAAGDNLDLTLWG